jgi:hypothetical protein
MGYLPTCIHSTNTFSLKGKHKRLGVSYLLPKNLDTDNVGVGIELELLLLGGCLAGVGGVEDFIEFFELLSGLVEGFGEGGEWNLQYGPWSQA